MKTVGDIQMNWNYCKEVSVKAAIHLNKPQHGAVLSAEVIGA